MKISSILSMLCLLTGCISPPAPLPAISGFPQPVNTQTIIQELTGHA